MKASSLGRLALTSADESVRTAVWFVAEGTTSRYVDSSQDTLDLYNNARDGGRPSTGSSDINTFTKDKSEGHNLTAALAFDNLGIFTNVNSNPSPVIGD